MTYALQSDLVDRFGSEELAQRTDRALGLVIDGVVLARALNDVDAEIDSYLASRYQLPLASVPVVLVRLACDMARYRLYDDGVPETVRVRYQDAVSMLKRLASGEVQVAGSTPVAAATNSSAAMAVRAPAAVFGSEILAGY